MIGNEYLAGVLDSDGSFSISKRHLKRSTVNYIVLIQITWTKSEQSRRVFDFLVKYYGGSVCEVKKSKTSLAKRPALKYCASGKAAERILLACRRYVILKNQQVTNCLEVLSTIKDFKQKYGGKFRPKRISNKLEKLYQKNIKQNFVHDKSRE